MSIGSGNIYTFETELTHTSDLLLSQEIFKRPLLPLTIGSFQRQTEDEATVTQKAKEDHQLTQSFEEDGSPTVLKNSVLPDSLSMEAEIAQNESNSSIEQDNLQSEFEGPLETICAAKLKLPFNFEFSYAKGTNTSKFIINKLSKLLPSLQRFLPDEKSKQDHVKYLKQIFQRFEKQPHNSLRDMQTLFGIQKNVRQTHWAMLRRMFVQQLLVSQVKSMVLENRHLRADQQVHYMYCLRIYQWRLNSESLVSNFN